MTLALMLAVALPAFAQTSLNSTTLAAAVTEYAASRSS
jgi:hypothetical protein